MEEIKLDHCSPIGNLTELDPTFSKGGFNYISATQYKEYALLYATVNNKKGLDGAYGVKNGIPYFIEMYPGAIEQRFKGMSGYLYEIDTTNFDENIYKKEQKQEVLNRLKF